MDENYKISVIQFVAKKYHEPIVVLKELSSYEDTNILIQSTKQDPDSKSDHDKFVLKILSTTNEAPENYARKIECVKCLCSGHFLCSHFLRGVDGNYIQTFPENGPFKNRSALLYSFLPGKELEYTGYVNFPVIVLELGSFLAHFHRCLRSMKNKEDLVPEPENPWSPHNYKLLFEDSCLEIVEDFSKKEILTAALGYVVKTLSPSEELLTKDILHGDFHGLNVIVNEFYNPEDRSKLSLFTKHSVNQKSTLHEKQSCSQVYDSIDMKFESLKLLTNDVQKRENAIQNFHEDVVNIYGIIDFEEMLYSYTVLEVGRLIADVMVVYLVQFIKKDEDSATSQNLSKKICTGQMECKYISAKLSESSKDHLLKIGGYVMAGYLMVNELSIVDLKCIYPAMLVSLCQYYILGTRAALDPSLNESYVSYCSREAIMLLEFFHQLDIDTTIHQWINVSDSMLRKCMEN